MSTPLPYSHPRSFQEVERDLRALADQVSTSTSTSTSFGTRFRMVTQDGALGDGSTDDTAAIQLTIDTIHGLGGGTVYFPPSSGGYGVNLNSFLSVYDNIQIIGSDYAGRIKRIGTYPMGVGGRLIFRNADTALGNSNIAIREMWIDGGADVNVPTTTVNGNQSPGATPWTLNVNAITTADWGPGGNQLRVVDSTGTYQTLTYTADTATTFTISAGGVGKTFNNGADVQQNGTSIASTAIKFQTSLFTTTVNGVQSPAAYPWTFNVTTTASAPTAGYAYALDSTNELITLQYDSKTGTSFNVIDGGKSHTFNNAAAVRYGAQCQQIRVQDVTINNWPGPAVHFQRAINGIASDCQILSNSRGGIILFGGCRQFVIQNNTIPNCKDDQIAFQGKFGSSIEEGHDIVIVGNCLGHEDEFGQATNNGISVNGMWDSLIADNITRDSYFSLKSGIEMADAVSGASVAFNKRVIVADNRIAFSDGVEKRGYGVLLGSGSPNTDIVGDSGAQDITLVDNMIRNAGLEGIGLVAGSSSGAGGTLTNIKVKGNDLIDCGVDATAGDRDAIRYSQASATAKVQNLQIIENNIVRPRASAIALGTVAVASIISGGSVSRNRITDGNYGANANQDVITTAANCAADRLKIFNNEYAETTPGTQRARYFLNLGAAATNTWLGPNQVDRKDLSSNIVQANGAANFRANPSSWGSWPAAKAAADGTDFAITAGTVYVVGREIPEACYATGLWIVNGSVIVDGGAVAVNLKLLLYDATGSKIATTASTAAVGTDAFQQIAFTAGRGLVPGFYWFGIVAQSAGYRFRAIPAFSDKPITGTDASGSFNTPPDPITPPTTFTADRGPIMVTY